MQPDVRKFLGKLPNGSVSSVYIPQQKPATNAPLADQQAYVAQITEKMGDGFTQLHIAAGLGYLDVLNSLIKPNTKLNTPNNMGDTAVHAAAENYQLAALERLIEARADITAQNIKGETPLNAATQTFSTSVLSTPDKIKVLKLLISCGNKITAPDRFGKTPADYLNENGLGAVEEFVRSTAYAE